ncbi:DUF1294 domain-containing protein [Sphingomonas koreensis]
MSGAIDSSIAVAAAALFLALVNLVTLLSFRHDKLRAMQGKRRVREADLLGLALIGGSPAALLARRLFRHKTRKQPFSTLLLLIVGVQAGALIGLLLI